MSTKFDGQMSSSPLGRLWLLMNPWGSYHPWWRCPGRRWGSLNLCFKIFDKFAWIIVIFFLSEDDPSGDGLKDDDELKPVDYVDWNWWPDELFSSWPALTSDEPLGVLPPSMMVSWPATRARGPGRQPRPRLAMGQPQFVIQNLWQIRMNHHHLLPLWRWPFQRRARRQWQAETSRWCWTKVDGQMNSSPLGQLWFLMNPWGSYHPRWRRTGRQPGLGARGPGWQPRPGLAMGQPQFVIQNLWHICMNHHHLLPLWRWPFQWRAWRQWRAETSRWYRLKLMARWTLLLLASFDFWWTLEGLTTLDDGVRASDRRPGLGARAGDWGPARRWGSLNLWFKIFDKFAWIIIIFSLPEPDDDLAICQDLTVRQDPSRRSSGSRHLSAKKNSSWFQWGEAQIERSRDILAR